MTNLSLRLYVGVRSAISSLVENTRREDGQDLIEYAVLAGGIGIALFAVFALTPLSAAFTAFAGSVGGCVDLAAGTACP